VHGPPAHPRSTSANASRPRSQAKRPDTGPTATSPGNASPCPASLFESRSRGRAVFDVRDLALIEHPLRPLGRHEGRLAYSCFDRRLESAGTCPPARSP
jgi:hypothetical protein